MKTVHEASHSLSPEAEEAFGNALQSVCDGILSRADEERKKTEPWKQLFAASEGGLRGILSDSSRQMMTIALNTHAMIKEKFHLDHSSPKLFNLVKALCFAMNHVRNEIDDSQGMSCCADKARQVYYEEVLAEIKAIQEETTSGKKRS